MTANNSLLRKGTDVYILPWLRNTAKKALFLILKAGGLFTQIDELALLARKTPIVEVQRKLEAAALYPVEDKGLLPYVIPPEQKKWNRLILKTLLKKQQRREFFDLAEAKTWLIGFGTLSHD